MSQARPSKKQRELLSFIEGFIGGHGYGPSYREIMTGLNYKSVSTVATHVDNLIAKGHLRKRDHSARSLEIVHGGAAEFKANTDVTAVQEKWLVDLIQRRFDLIEKHATPAQRDIDDLYVLVGATQILGLADAAVAFKSRLIKLTRAS